MCAKKAKTTKKKIVSAAWKLFYEQGYDNTTVDDIVEESGTSKGSFYHYFEGKDALLSSLSFLFDEKYEELMPSVDPQMHSVDKLLYLNRELFGVIENTVSLELLVRLFSSQLITKGERHLLDSSRVYYKILRQITTIQERLKDLRLNKGLKLEELAEQTGISKSALGSYEKDDYKEINHGNLILLADFYGVSLDYLFCRTENRAEINTPLRELHLSDEMVALLKSGRINNRLLCELATHKDFIKFLADIEIYVDGIATMQIQNLNALVDTVRHEIIERYRPGEDDPHLKVLQAAHISDDEYFSHMVLDDLNLIIRDIREAHKKDSESAPQTTVANELKENLEAVENFKGSRDEKLVVLYCKQLGINYKNLSDEEFRWLIRILKKSKKMGTPISQRKKR